MRGIDSFGQSSVDISVACKVKPMKQWEVERGMRLAIKEAFDRRGIEFPYPRMVTVPWGEHLSPSPEEEDTPPFGWVPSPAPEFAEEDLLDSGLEDSADEDADGDGTEENSK